MKTVLFIDDNAIEQNLIESEIEDQKLKITASFQRSAESAITYLEDCVENKVSFPDIIVVDIHMGGKSGDEFIDEYSDKFYKAHPKTKLYYLSNSFMLPDEDEYAEYPFVKGAFEKPFTKEIFRKMSR